MNLRLPIALGVVAVAAATAAVHAFRHDPAPFATSAPSVGDDGASPAPFPTRRPLAAGKPARVTVYVAGHVLRPGVYALPVASRAVDAVRAAGGTATDADPIAVNLAERVTDGQEIVVPVKGATAPPEAGSTPPDPDATPAEHAKKRHHRRKRRSHRRAATPATDSATAGMPAIDADAPAQMVDLNTADENELEALPGIGSSLAERIVAFRAINGPFTSADDLLDVGGMTQNRLDAIAPYVTTR